ncbi:hypothetical protein L6270_02150 [Candidatus Parcubacteria bacterium]|nr:hypothetical protein [Patescibacteria group bacterium]MBU4309458.1 hypothetical protein [Patescibacteria group bacterium]MBU4432420.1 hypothetical protein [Patescibacteria group bacterium]MBU4577819.1 hypothetical protein [Patescibacteria group bacterium]MCG2696812.1 hypothetical protein [Candidatus Parcubacteria bacterium]
MKQKGFGGKFVLTPEEKAILDREMLGEFERSKAFLVVDVNIRQVDISKVPRDIQNKIAALCGKTGTIISFVAVKTSDWIPSHRHKDDCEIYFYGKNASVRLFDVDQKIINDHDLGADDFAVTFKGESHGTNCGSGAHSVFGVKFT